MNTTHQPLPIYPTDPTRGLELDAKAADDATIERALAILARRMAHRTAVAESSQFNSVNATRAYLTLALAELEHEEFHILFLNTQHRLIHHDCHSKGTIDSASVYRREVVKNALAHNATAVILAHNHPSGHSDPSESDKHITRLIQGALGLVDIRVLDHVIVAGPQPSNAFSFAEAGLL